MVSSRITLPILRLHGQSTAGGLYYEARPENFPSVNDYSNPLVAEAIRVMKYVNKFKRGVIRVQ